MQRRALLVATLASVLSSFACGSDPGARSASAAGTSSGGQALGGAAQGGTAGALAAAGSSVGGQTQPSGGTASGGISNGGVSNGGVSNGGASTAGTMSGGAASGAGGSGAGAGGGPPKATGTPLVYVGGFGQFPLRAYELDKSSGALKQRGGDEDGGSSPSYLALDPSGTHLYNANEDDGSTAGVTAHHIKADGTLEKLNHQQGTKKTCNGSCGFTHVAVDPSGKFLFGADYDGGSVSVFPINADGSLGAEKQMLDLGSGSEAHSVAFDPGGKFAFVPTLGIDQVQQLKLSADGTLTANSPPNVAAASNSGPRHMAMHPNGKLAIVINETASTLTPYAVSADGKLTPGASVSSMPQGVSGKVYGQHLKLSPDGHFLYCSNVGHDSLGVFSVNQTNGALTWLQDQPSGGAWPRDFDVDPNGEFLVAANRDSKS
ncbi:MAG TPA: lactonase family protein, partial [Polyangiaceae bacterium]|nr:lactonase family protein [Polyangiaceae bacterium]